MRMLMLVVVVLWASPAWAVTLPTLPQKQVDVTMPTVNGSTLNATCATLQAQINAAAALNVNLTHRVILATGTTCTGPYVLPAHIGTGWILVTGPNGPDGGVVASGTRVTLANATSMPQIQYGEDAQQLHVGCFSAATNAQRYRLIGIDCVENLAYSINWAMINFMYSLSVRNTGNLIMDRMIIRDRDASHATRRSILADAESGSVAILDSYVIGAKSIGSDTQAILVVSNPGPILVQNNYLEADGENMMLCGSKPNNAADMPHDITVVRNTFDKNQAHAGASSYIMKTLFETKCGVRILIEGNTFQNMPWNDGGYAFRLTPRNDDYTNASATFMEVSDLTIRHNLASNVTNFINSIGSDDGSVNGDSRLQTRHSKRWAITNNLVYGLGWFCGGGASCGRFYSIQTGGSTLCTDYVYTCKNEELSITHNTVDNVVQYTLGISSGMEVNLDFKDNLIADGGQYGICGNAETGTSTPGATSCGSTLLSRAWTWSGSWGSSTYNFLNNGIAGLGSSGCCGPNSSSYPQGTNWYPLNASSFGWTNRSLRDYTLAAGSPARNAASDGTDMGVNFTAYNAARAGTGPPPTDIIPPTAPTGVTISKVMAGHQ